MFDVSWGEIAVLGAVGVAVTGKRDLPRACRFVGQQLGRVVGLLQGARARADRFAHHNELRALQNELRSGLRELDRVKTEIAVAASSPVGRGLGPITPSANRAPRLSSSPSSSVAIPSRHQPQRAPVSPSSLASSTIPTTTTTSSTAFANKTGGDARDGVRTSNGSKHPDPMPLDLSDFDFHVSDSVGKDDHGFQSTPPSPTTPVVSEEHSTMQEQQQNQPGLSPAAQSERAVMEEEWTKQGIGFRARAERGSWTGGDDDDNSWVGAFPLESSGIGGGLGPSDGSDPSVADTTRATGSELLEHLERQCLIFDQYDRVVGEQEAELQQRIERMQTNRKEQQQQRTNEQSSNSDNDTSSNR